MNSDEIFDVIDQVASTTKKTEKEAIIKRHIDDDDFRRVLFVSLDPLITYGMQKVPAPSNKGTSTFNEDVWVLIDKLARRELTGNDAFTQVADTMLELSPKSGELLKRIIRKDLRAGFGASTANKASKGLIRTFPYMRCSLTSKVDISKWDWGQGILSQEKADGMFANVDHEHGGIVKVTSRQGTEYPLGALKTFTEEIRTRIPSGYQLHGEFLVERDGKILPRAESNGVMNHIQSGGQFNEGDLLRYFVWDAIPLESVVPKGEYKFGYQFRLKSIIKWLAAADGKHVELIPTRLVKSQREAFKHYAELLKQGKEGTIIKRPDAIWKDGTSKHQVKLKLEVDVDLRVTDIVPGREGTKNEGRPGSLTCVTSCGELLVDVAVKNEKMRDHVEAHPSEWIDKIIVVRANDILDPSDSNAEYHSLFLPRMVEAAYRTDKEEADSLQQVRDQFESAIEAA